MFPLEDYPGQLAEMEANGTDGIDSPCLEDAGFNSELHHMRVMDEIGSPLNKVRREIEALCSDPGIPEELKAEFDKFWNDAHHGLTELQNRINEFRGD